MLVAERQRLAPGFDFATYINGLGANVTDVLVAQPSAFKGIAAAIAGAKLQVLKDALLIRSLDGFSDDLPDAIAKASFAFYGTTLSGTPEMERSEEHTSELNSLMRISYAVFCLKKHNKDNTTLN